MEQEVSVINAENFSKIKKLLLSKDEGSKNVGLAIIEQSALNDSPVYSLCLIKETFPEVFHNGITIFDLVDKTPNVSKFLKDNFNNATSIDDISFQAIFEFAKGRSSKEEAEFMLSLASRDFGKLIEKYNFPFKEFAEVKLVLKDF